MSMGIITDYGAHVVDLEQWYRASSLVINVGKSEEIILNQTAPFSSLILCYQTVKQLIVLNIWATIYIYIYDKKSFNNNTD